MHCNATAFPLEGFRPFLEFAVGFLQGLLLGSQPSFRVPECLGLFLEFLVGLAEFLLLDLQFLLLPLAPLQQFQHPLMGLDPLNEDGDAVGCSFQKV